MCRTENCGPEGRTALAKLQGSQSHGKAWTPAVGDGREGNGGVPQEEDHAYSPSLKLVPGVGRKGPDPLSLLLEGPRAAA